VGSHAVVIEVSDGSLIGTQSFSIDVINTNDAPVITSNGGGASAELEAEENQTAVTTMTDEDVDVGDTTTFSITGGPDAGRFSITSSGVLTFKVEPDFEYRADANGDGIYQVEVSSSDGNGGTDVQTLSVRVTNVPETPPEEGLPASPPPGPGNQFGNGTENSPESAPDATKEQAEDSTGRNTGLISMPVGEGEIRTDISPRTVNPDAVAPETLANTVTTERQVFDSSSSQSVVSLANQVFLSLMNAAGGFDIQSLASGDTDERFDHSDSQAMQLILDNLAEEMSRSGNQDIDFDALSLEAAGAALSLTAGALIWVLRTGSLAASLLSVMPMWAHIDPLPVLSEGENLLDTDFDLDQPETLDLRSKAEDLLGSGQGSRS